MPIEHKSWPLHGFPCVEWPLPGRKFNRANPRKPSFTLSASELPTWQLLTEGMAQGMSESFELMRQHLLQHVASIR